MDKEFDEYLDVCPECKMNESFCSADEYLQDRLNTFSQYILCCIRDCKALDVKEIIRCAEDIKEAQECSKENLRCCTACGHWK